ncbi:hypothetical protein CDAR_43581 [Caerostris darwini]|uniref:Uncharacterized protein n=1 Tax=Caerostris darwini TaxID=1538125 RepID=A0AAV4WHC8_9ARAC|nr:hypothetical protein CDAR_43581 [Caerostris darwini]
MRFDALGMGGGCERQKQQQQQSSQILDVCFPGTDFFVSLFFQSLLPPPFFPILQHPFFVPSPLPSRFRNKQENFPGMHFSRNVGMQMGNGVVSIYNFKVDVPDIVSFGKEKMAAYEK